MAHGDRLTSRCFWQHGLAITDPGLALTKHRLSAYVVRLEQERPRGTGGRCLHRATSDDSMHSTTRSPS